MSTILIIDDEQGIRDVLKDVFEDEGYRVLVAEDGYQGLNALKREGADVVILDVWLPNLGGIEVLKRLKEDHPDLEVVIISGHANINLAVQAVKMGAFDFLEKPLSLEKTMTAVENALKLERLRKENRRLKQTLFQEDAMIGRSPAMGRVREIIAQSAGSDARVLILGENGTGKELAAKEIHRRSPRAQAPFVEVNCASIPETLIESELFGHEKGSFTDAVSRRKGKFELADGGTLFLDEITDMSLATQAKVLRAIQELRFERLGGEESIQVDVRLVAATNKNIEAEVRAGRFREDLYFRINVIPIHIPPLRERLEDLEALIAYFMRRYKRSSTPEPKRISPGALEILKLYPWPGNIRELKNFVERVNIMTEEDEIPADRVRAFLGVRPEREEGAPLNRFASMKLGDAMDEFERELIQRKLRENDNNISRTSKSLGVTPSNLHNKLKKHGIKIER